MKWLIVLYKRFALKQLRISHILQPGRGFELHKTKALGVNTTETFSSKVLAKPKNKNWA